MSAKRIDPEQARRDVSAGKALLVCAYDDPEKSQRYRLPEATSLAELKAQEAKLDKNREIIFYCA